MRQILETDLPRERYDVFEVTQITRGTPLESVVAADLVSIAPGRASEVHRHNGAETVLLILDGSGTVLCLASIRIPGRRSLFFPDASAGCYSVAAGAGRPFLACSTRLLGTFNSTITQ
jgi:hypothetical protein